MWPGSASQPDILSSMSDEVGLDLRCLSLLESHRRRAMEILPIFFLLAVFITFSKSIAYFKLKQMTISRLINTCIFAF